MPPFVLLSANMSVSQMFALPGAGYVPVTAGNPASPLAEGLISQYH
jgi:hypothetical protein